MVFSYIQNETDLLYGEALTSIVELRDKPKLTIKKGNEIRGTLELSQLQVVEVPSFLDYLRSGWSINMSVAIDFTASNGEIYSHSSLHK